MYVVIIITLFNNLKKYIRIIIENNVIYRFFLNKLNKLYIFLCSKELYSQFIQFILYM